MGVARSDKKACIPFLGSRLHGYIWSSMSSGEVRVADDCIII